MNKRSQKRLKVSALLVVFSLLSTTSAVALASPAYFMAAMQATGKLTTAGNRAITVNGVPANSGDTILTGSTIETPDMVGASIDLGPLGSIDIAPNTKIQVTFAGDGTVRVTLTEGCLILRVKQGAYGVIANSEGEVTNSDPNRKSAALLDVCLPKGAPTAIVNQGAAANAGAGAGATGGTVAEEGVSGAVVGTLIAGGTGLGILVLVLVNRGENSSPSS
ncbi:MAG TPA: hypothetical protein VM095_03625 [Pyrinomonadaceae bacterium]|nr:hypothetical protein [Pyrinomonadaceae bacterium]